MDRTERLLDLVALFLDRSEPVSWAELREGFPEDYARGSDEASERKFERDKAELLELGIPLAYVQGDEDRKDGYIVDREAYYLPDPKLTPEELAVLYAAGSAAAASGAFPGQDDLAHALRKIAFLSGGALTPPAVRMELGAGQGGPELAQKLEALRGAIFARKSVTLDYFSPRNQEVSQRKVDPYGLALRRGIWSLVGYCHLREGIRTFHVHRIRELVPNTQRPKSPDFERPEGFSLEKYVAAFPWQHRFHEPQPAVLRLTGEVAPLAERLFPGARLEARDGAVEAHLSVTFGDGLIRYALSLSPECAVVGPEPLRERFAAMARRIAQAHGGEP
jgi:proteasome accessory factor B